MQIIVTRTSVQQQTVDVPDEFIKLWKAAETFEENAAAEALINTLLDAVEWTDTLETNEEWELVDEEPCPATPIS